MGSYISITSVRRTCGISESQISDADIESSITEIEREVKKQFNTAFVPTEVIENYDGDGTNRLLLDFNPVLSVRDLYIDGTQEDTANLEIDKNSGYIYLGSSATTARFLYGRNKVVVKYIHGLLEHSETVGTTTSAASVAGTSVSLSVASETGFSDGDWIEIFGMDGLREVAQISGDPTTGIIVVDQLVLAHESGSSVKLLEVNPVFTKFMNIVAGLAGVSRVVGESASDTTGYDLSELHVQKGEPYTQWRETAIQLIRERDELKKILLNRPYIM